MKKKRLADEISALINPAPRDIDPESVGFDLRSKTQEEEDEDDALYQSMSAGSQLRKTLPLELNSKLYQGKVVKRSEVNDSDTENEDDNVIKDDDEDVTLPEAEQNKINREKETEGLDEDQTISDQTKKAEILDDEEEELKASLALVSTEEEQSGRAELRNESMEDLAEKLGVQQSSLNVGLDAEEGEREKSQHIRHQRTLWEWTLNLRIRLQKPLAHANRLPPHSIYPAFQKSEDLKKRYQRVSVKTSDLLSKLLSLQHVLTQQHSLAPTTPLPSSTSSTSDPAPVPVSSTESYWKCLETNFQTLLPWVNETIEKWNKKTQQASGQAALSDRKFKVINQGVVSQIDWIMKSSQELIQKTQLKRSEYTVLGKRKRELDDVGSGRVTAEDEETLAIIDGRKEEYDTEILDDTDFYQSLLREIIQSGLEYNSSLEDPSLLEKAQVLKKKTKKKKDRISKDKKIRYVIHPKLVNFVAPVKDHDDTFLVDELLSRLFGQKQFSTSTTLPPSS